MTAARQQGRRPPPFGALTAFRLCRRWRLPAACSAIKSARVISSADVRPSASLSTDLSHSERGRISGCVIAGGCPLRAAASYRRGSSPPQTCARRHRCCRCRLAIANVVALNQLSQPRRYISASRGQNHDCKVLRLQSCVIWAYFRSAHRLRRGIRHDRSDAADKIRENIG